MSTLQSPHRRRLITSAGAIAAFGALRPYAAFAQPRADVTARLARYMAAAADAPLPAAVATACKQRILDTFGAIVSGSRLPPGRAVTRYMRGLGGTAQASLLASNVRTTAENAALANAMYAHSDETDDMEPFTKAHPGSSVVPAALAMAEKNGASGAAFIRAVALGYDVGCRLLMALDPPLVRVAHRSAEGVGSTFCALGSAAPLARLNEQQMRYAISYASQQVAGLWSWVSDVDHVEKSFDIAGMGARNGVQAVTMVESGMTGVNDVLDGPHNLLIALSTQPRPEAMVEGLGTRFYVLESAIKKFAVGYPNQSVLDALLILRKEHGLTPQNVRSILVKVPTDALGIVGSSAMADVSCQHLASIALSKGGVTFKDSHDLTLMKDPALLAIRARVRVEADPILDDPVAPRGAIVEVTTTDGRQLRHHTRFPPGAKENPLSDEAVNTKVRDLLAPVLGASKTDRLIDRINNLEKVTDIRQLRPLWSA